MREIQKARTATVEIGIHEDAKTPEGLTIAEYAIYNEYGTSRIPERSFMRSAFDENVGKIKADMDKQYKAVISGQSTVYRALRVVGNEHASDVKLKIRNLKTPKNADSTIARKKSDNPLIQDGHMLRSVVAIVKGHK